MFFLQHKNYIKQSDKQYLTRFISVLKNSFFDTVKTPLVLIRKNIIHDVVRRMSLQSLQKASITLEAALVLPVFLFFFLNLFSVIEMLRLYGNMAYALNMAGGDISLYGYGWKENGVDIGVIGDTAFSYLYLREKIVDVLGEDYIEQSPLVNGKEGIIFTKVKIGEGECVEFEVSYEMRLPFGMADYGTIRVYNTYLGRAWTGYEVLQTDKIWVFITENGTVYHSEEKCSHLELHIRQTNLNQVKELRNIKGKCYTPCEFCGKRQGNEVWITESGEKYHKIKECSGLKRTIYKITMEEAKKKGYVLCSRCKEE